MPDTSDSDETATPSHEDEQPTDNGDTASETAGQHGGEPTRAEESADEGYGEDSDDEPDDDRENEHDARSAADEGDEPDDGHESDDGHEEDERHEEDDGQEEDDEQNESKSGSPFKTIVPVSLGIVALVIYFIWLFLQMSVASLGGISLPGAIFGAVIIGIIAGALSLLVSRNSASRS